eukprot:gene10043-2362_t
MAVNISDQEIVDAWTTVKSDDGDINWMLCSYADKASLKLFGKGTGGYDEFVQQLVEDEILFGVCKVYAVDEDSKRTKFIQLTWVGEKVKPMARAKVSTHKSTVLAFFKGAHLELHSTSLEDLQKDAVSKTLQGITGSHKPKCYDWSDGTTTDI